MRRTRKGPPRFAAIFLVVLAVLAFITTIAAQAANSAVLNEQYYKDVIADTNAVERTFAEIAGDDAMKDPVNDLLGDVVPKGVLDGFLGDDGPLGALVPNEIIQGLGEVIAEPLAEEILNTAIDNLIRFLRDGNELELTLDVTDIIGGVGSVVNRRDLEDSQFISRERRGDQTRLLLGPPEEIRKKIEDSLSIVQLIASISPWLRFVGLGVLVAAIAALTYLAAPARTAMVRWPGIALLAAGISGFAFWAIAEPLFQDLVIDAAFEGGMGPAPAFDRLARDVLNTLISNISPHFWVPSGVAAVMGVVLIGLSMVAPSRPIAAR